MSSAALRAGRRAALVLACYALSAQGLLLSLGWLLLGSRRGVSPWLIGAVLALAWGLHALMCLNWVLDRRLPAPWPAVGAVAAGGVLVLAPLLWSDAPGLWPLARAVGLGLLLTAPCVLLALHLLRFHRGQRSG